MDVQLLSDRLRAALRDLEQITNDLETIHAQAQSVANDDIVVVKRDV